MRPVGFCLPDADVAGRIPAKAFTRNVADLFRRGIVSTAREVIIPNLDKSPVSDQGQLGSCVANAVCDGLEICRAQEGDVEQLSRLSCYSWSRALHGASYEDKGTYIRCALSQSKTIGVLPESKWPYNPAMVNVPPPNKLIVLASDNRVRDFYKIDESERVDMVKLSLRAHQPVAYSSYLDKNKYQAADPTSIFDTPQVQDAAHAQLLVGFRELDDGSTLFMVRNSWGIGWGDRGYTLITEAYLGSDAISETWAMTRMGHLVL